MASLPSVKELRSFVEIYRAGGITAAADRLALTHSAVGLLLRQLEEKLDVTLFERTTRSVRPTEAANALISGAERMLRDLHEFAERGRQLGRSRSAMVRVAVTPMVAQTLLPFALAKFATFGLDAQVLVDDCSPEEFIGLVQTGRVDFGIGAPEVSRADLEIQVLSRDDLTVCGADLPGRAASVAWKELDGHSVIALRQGYGLRGMIEAAAQNAGIRLLFRHEVTLLSTAFAMASQHLGVVILPSALAHLADKPALQMKRITRPVTPRHLYLVSRKGARLPEAGRAFCKAVEQVLADVVAQAGTGSATRLAR